MEVDRYFPTFAASEVPRRCPKCSTALVKGISLIRFHDFQPFFTRNILPRGQGVFVSDRAQLRGLMRKYHLRESPLNDTPEGRADPREFQVGAREDAKRFPQRYKKLKEKVRAMTDDQARPLAERAQRTKFETV